MSPHQRPEDRYLEGRELPQELLKKFTDWGIVRQELDSFRDRLWATCPTKREVQTVAQAKNPWAELAKLEERPLPPRQERFHKPHDGADRDREEEEPATERTEPTELSQTPLPKIPFQNPYTDRIRDMSDKDLFQFHDDFIRLYHLDSPYAVPEAILKDSKLFIYQALVAEVALRRPGK